MKGIAIQTIILLLVGILVSGVLIYLVYSHVSGPALTTYECRAQLTSWCTSCMTMGWKGGPKLSPQIAECTSKYLGYTTVQNIDCDDNIGSVGGSCSVGGASPTCPNVTICRAVGIGV